MSSALTERCSNDTTTLTIEDIGHLLSTTRRQHIVEIVDDEQTVTTRELVAAVTERERDHHDVDASDVARLRNSVRANLVQRHIPTLVDHGVVSCNGDTITTGTNFRDVADAICRLEEVLA